MSITQIALQNATDFIKQKKEKIRIQSTISMKDIGRKTNRKYIIEAASFLICEDFDKKILVLERLRVLKPENNVAYDVAWYDGKIEYRIGYYIVGRNGNKKDKWTWGQYCPMIGHNDFLNLISLAQREGTMLAI